MPWGFRIPSLRKRVAARTSVSRYARHSLGLKAPRGWGWLTNPGRALYNRIYHRTTVGVEDLAGPRRRSRAGCLLMLLVLLPLLAGAALYLRPRPLNRSAGPIPQEAYVWQRAWTADVADISGKPPASPDTRAWS